jgi:hypothetical protein
VATGFTPSVGAPPFFGFFIDPARAIIGDARRDARSAENPANCGEKATPLCPGNHAGRRRRIARSIRKHWKEKT